MTGLLHYPERRQGCKGRKRRQDTALYAVLTRGRKLDTSDRKAGVSGIEIFGGYLPVYHDRKSLTNMQATAEIKRAEVISPENFNQILII